MPFDDDALGTLAAVALAAARREYPHKLLGEYFSSALVFPIRSGTHRDTAFSLGLTLQAARRRGDDSSAAALRAAAVRALCNDGPRPWADDPAGDAFLTAPLTEAPLMSDVLARLVPGRDRPSAAA